jgi:hypothetical protein
MSDTKKTRVMSIKGFLHKAGGRVSAAAFLEQHRAWLQTGKLAEVTSSILRMWDEKQLLPTPALDRIKDAVLAHHLRVETQKAEKQLAAEQEGSPSGHSSKPWVVTCYDSKGHVCSRTKSTGEVVDIHQTFQLQQRASEWADRRLVHDCASDCFAVIIHQPSGLEVVILRGDAMARVFPKVKAPISKRTGVRDDRLSFGAKVAQSRAHFSHG